MLWIALLLASAVNVGPPRAEEELCPYCGEDPELMSAAGIVSHGPFDFGVGTTEDVDRLLPTYDLLWTETKHFQLGTALRRYKLGDKEKKKVRAELERLQLALPEVEPRTRFLDPWLRAHLYAQRAEDLWKRFQEIAGVTDADFPGGTGPRNIALKYMGQGPHMGQKGKYELLIVPSKAASRLYLTEQFGLTIERTQRWNVVARDTLTVTMNLEEDQVKRDEALHGHVVFNLLQVLLDGYKHYNYDTPLWYHEGLAHVLEREISPDFNSFDGSEGSLAATTRKSDWLAEVRKLVRGDDAPRLAELTRLRQYSQFELEHHFATWSMVQYLLVERPEAFACFLDRMHGAVDEQAQVVFTDMQDHQRSAFQDCVGIPYAQFDEAWREWVASKEAELAQE